MLEEMIAEPTRFDRATTRRTNNGWGDEPRAPIQPRRLRRCARSTATVLSAPIRRQIEKKPATVNALAEHDPAATVLAPHRETARGEAVVAVRWDETHPSLRNEDVRMVTRAA